MIILNDRKQGVSKTCSISRTKRFAERKARAPFYKELQLIIDFNGRILKLRIDLNFFVKRGPVVSAIVLRVDNFVYRLKKIEYSNEELSKTLRVQNEQFSEEKGLILSDNEKEL